MLGGSFNGQQIHITNGVCYNLYWSVNDSQWHYRAAGGGALAYFDTNPANPVYNIYTAPNGGAGAVAGISNGFYITGTDVVANRTFTCTGNIWATNRGGAFGLQDFGGGVWGMRFATDGWRLQWNSNNGQLAFINNLGTGLWTCDGSGNTGCAGQFVAGTGIYCYNGVAFGSQNSWEYHTYVEAGSGDHIMYHRSGGSGAAWYERWSSSGGASRWVKNVREVMTLDDGTLSVIDRINTGTVAAGYIHSEGNIDAKSTFTGGAVTVSGDVYGSACYHPNGVFVGGSADTSFGFYNSGGSRIWQMNPNKYWGCNAGNGDLNYNIDGARMIGIWRYSAYAGTNFTINNPTAGGAFVGYNFIQAWGRSAVSRTATTMPGLKELMKVGFSESTTEASENVPARRSFACAGQDLAEVLPEVAWAYDGEDGPGYSTSLGSLLAVAVSAIKELGARVIALEAANGA
jgi:hypothetical protein